MRVLLADDDRDVRAALRLLLTQDLGMSVVGEAVDAADLSAQVRDATPDLLLLDWGLIRARASDAMADLRALSPRLRIVVLSAHPEVQPHALAAGATAFVSKADAPAHLMTTLRAFHVSAAPGHPDDGTGAAHAPERPEV